MTQKHWSGDSATEQRKASRAWQRDQSAVLSNTTRMEMSESHLLVHLAHWTLPCSPPRHSESGKTSFTGMFVFLQAFWSAALCVPCALSPSAVMQCGVCFELFHILIILKVRWRAFISISKLTNLPSRAWPANDDSSNAEDQCPLEPSHAWLLLSFGSQRPAYFEGSVLKKLKDSAC